MSERTSPKKGGKTPKAKGAGKAAKAVAEPKVKAKAKKAKPGVLKILLRP